MVDHALDAVKRTHEELVDGLNTLFPQFQTASNNLVKELTRRVQELERREQRHQQQVDDFQTRIGDLETDNRSLKGYKQDYEDLHRVSEGQKLKLTDYAHQIDELTQQNRQLIDRHEHVKQDLSVLKSNENQLANDLNRQMNDQQALIDQLEHNKKTELANQAAEHSKAMSKQHKHFSDALKKLEHDIDHHLKIISDQQAIIDKQHKELTLIPIKVRTELIHGISKAPLSNAHVPPPNNGVSSTLPRANPARLMHNAVAGSSISSSSGSSSSYMFSRRRPHSVEPVDRNRKRLR